MPDKSTSLILFGYDPLSIKLDGKWVDFDSIFEVKTKGHIYRSIDCQKSVFWRSLIRRQWQYDDFTFGHMAAAEFIPDAHRYKIHFNPYLMYKNAMSWESGVIRDEEDPKMVKMKIETAWSQALGTGNYCGPESDMTMRGFGWNHDLALELEKCKEEGKWTEEGWKMWTHLLATNIHFSHNICYVMMHEVQHIISDHLTRCGKKNAGLWNIATDYAINQNLGFSINWSMYLITKKNSAFWKNMVGCICKWLCMTDIESANDMYENFELTSETDIEKFKSVHIDLQSNYIYEDNYTNSDKFANKSANFYYEVYEEIMNEQDGQMPSDFAPVDDHDTWKNGIEAEEGNEEKAESKKGGQSSDEKDRSGGISRNKHTGFNKSIARNEAKNSVRKSLERAGYDCASDEDIEKALKEIPNLGSMGHTITEWFGAKKINWKRQLTSELKFSMNATTRDYTMKREHRAMDDVFPGKTLQLGLDFIIGMDTSASVQGMDWNDFVHQVEYISKDCDVYKTRVIQCHTVIAFDEYVNLRKIKKMEIKEIGGTTMKVIAEKLKREKNRKLCIIFTDGAVDTFYQKDYPFKIIMFLSRGNTYYKKSLEARGFKVICQDDE